MSLPRRGKCQSCRDSAQENRRDKDIVGGFAIKFPDYTFLPKTLFGYSNKPTFCLEIKPKQGFICEPDRFFKKCPFCLTQFYKKRRGSVREISGYCPLDLFSGERDRMDQALRALLRSPQNNLKIFRDGTAVYQEGLADEDNLARILGEWLGHEEALGTFHELVYTALTRVFESHREETLSEIDDAPRHLLAPSRIESTLLDEAKVLLARVEQECELVGKGPSSRSVLGRILRMQSVHQCSMDAVTWIHANLASVLTDDLIHTQVIGQTVNDQCETLRKICEVEYQKKYQLNNTTTYNNIEEFTSKINTLDSIVKKNNCQKALEKSPTEEIVQRDFMENVTFKDCLDILKNYLLFCTAKDCSIMMTFQEVDKETTSAVNFQHIINLPSSRTFLVAVRVLDLDMKSLQCIEKHRLRDINVIKAIISELKQKSSI